MSESSTPSPQGDDTVVYAEHRFKKQAPDHVSAVQESVDQTPYGAQANMGDSSPPQGEAITSSNTPERWSRVRRAADLMLGAFRPPAEEKTRQQLSALRTEVTEPQSPEELQQIRVNASPAHPRSVSGHRIRSN